MKKLIIAGLALAALTALPSCLGNDEPDDDVKAWRDRNVEFVEAKAAEKDAAGTPVYERVTAAWDPSAYVLMRWHNDRSKTQGELMPLSNSTVDCKYQLTNIDGKMLDNSYSRTQPADSTFRTRLNQNIVGWVMAVTNMHVGDSCTVIVPWQQGYGSTATLAVPAYSTLIFGIKLTAIPGYEKQP